MQITNKAQLTIATIRFYKESGVNKNQSEPILLTLNWYLNYLINPTCEGVNRSFVLSFGNDSHQRIYRALILLSSDCSKNRLYCYD